MRAIVTIYFFFLFSGYSQAQERACATPDPTSDQIQMLNNLPGNYKNEAIMKSVYPLIKLPLRFHIVAASNGSFAVSADTLFAELSRVNMLFQPVGIEFFLCAQPDLIKDNDLYNFHIAKAGNPKIQSKLDANSIDIFFFNSINTGSGGACGYTYLPGGPDYVMMSGNCLNGVTLAHELGHYLGLYHTHGKAGLSSTDELVDGSNCATAGDDICDTPADPNLWGQVSDSCQFTGVSTDLNGAVYTPSISNLMSYSREKCKFQFSPMQAGRMREVVPLHRSYLCCSAPDLKYSITVNGSTINFYDSSETSMKRRWDFGDGNFSTDKSGSYTYAKEESYTIAFQSENACGKSSVLIPLNLLDLAKTELKNIRLHPNPADADMKLFFPQHIEFGRIMIYDPMGQLLSTIELRDASELLIRRDIFPAPGIYFINLELGQERICLKAVLR